MADQQHRAGPDAEGAFQPLNRLYVEVIGRLVQDQQIRSIQEQTSEEHTRLLPPAEVRQRHVPLVGGKAKPIQHLSDTQLVIVAAGQLKALLGRSIALE